ncbi:rhodanese-like domain-containing protein [Kitasatospora sp. NPDC059571]|uniref:rhodanese-like domain-containing protein n=1 Tax=Kitasatospora sp. NPDC059571 TaxID=3346871 RepID=UPI0036C27C71
MSTTLTAARLHADLDRLTVVDVRSPGEFAAGHLPGAHNVPLDLLHLAVPALRAAAARGPLAVVCASGNRSATACERLAAEGVSALGLAGGTSAWAAAGLPLHRPAGARAVWAMDRQVRFAAGSLVLAGLFTGRLLRPGARWLSAAVAGGLVFSAATDTCAMGNVLGRLPHNRPRTTTADLAATLTALQGQAGR